jgi:hypothetical protein
MPEPYPPKEGVSFIPGCVVILFKGTTSTILWH